MYLQCESKIVPPLRLLHIFLLAAISTDENLPSCLPFICLPICQFWSTYLIIRESCNTFYNINPWILTVHFSLLQYLQSFFLKWSYYIPWSHSVKVFFSNHHVSDQILFLKCPPLLTYKLQVICRSPSHLSNGFLWQDILNSGIVWFWLQFMLSFQDCCPSMII